MISSEITQAQLIGNGVATAIPTGIKVYASSQLKVYKGTNTSLGTLLVEGVDYSVSSVAAVDDTGLDNDITAVVTMNSAPAENVYIRVLRETEDRQGTSIRAAKAFDPTVLEVTLDKIVMRQQEFATALAGALKLFGVTSDFFVPAPNGVLGFNADGKLSIVSGALPEASVASWLNAVLLSADQGAFRSGIGAITGSDVLGFAGVTTQVTDWDQLHTLARSGPVRGDAAAANGPGGLALAGYYTHTDANTGDLIVGAPALGARFHRARTGGAWGSWSKAPRDGNQLTNLDTVGVGVFFNLFDNTATGAMAGLGTYTAILFASSPSSASVRSQVATICTGAHAGRRFSREHNGIAWSAWWPEPVRVAATATGVAQLDLTIPAGLTRGRLTAEITPATAGANMAARLSADGGASFISTGTYSSFGQVLSHGSTSVSALDNVTNGTSIKLTGAVDPAVPMTLSLDLYAAASGVTKSDATYKLNGATDRIRACGQGLHATAGVNTIRLLASSGNFTIRYLWECFP